MSSFVVVVVLGVLSTAFMGFVISGEPQEELGLVVGAGVLIWDGAQVRGSHWSGGHDPDLQGRARQEYESHTLVREGQKIVDDD